MFPFFVFYDANFPSVIAAAKSANSFGLFRALRNGCRLMHNNQLWQSLKLIIVDKKGKIRGFNKV